MICLETSLHFPSCSETTARRWEENISTLTLLKDYFRTCSNMLLWIIYPAEPLARRTRAVSIKHLPMLLPHRGGNAPSDAKGDTSEQGVGPRGKGKTTLLAAKQMHDSLFNLSSESGVVIASELWMNSQSGSLEGLRVALFAVKPLRSFACRWNIAVGSFGCIFQIEARFSRLSGLCRIVCYYTAFMWRREDDHLLANVKLPVNCVQALLLS